MCYNQFKEMFKKFLNVKFLLVLIILIASFLRLYELTINPPSLFGDELVPKDTVTIDNSKNVIVPTGEHLFSIWSSLTWYSKPLIMFMTN